MVERCMTNEFLTLKPEHTFIHENLHFEQILAALATVGVTSVPLLREETRWLLWKSARQYSYQREPEVVGKGDRLVRQQVSSYNDLAGKSPFEPFKQSFQELLNQALGGVDLTPWETPLCFNSMVLQRYESGSIGITPHRDGRRYINLICIFVLAGEGKFYICADRSGRQSREVPAAAGDAILMKAPGFQGMPARTRPFHYVTQISTTRYTLGLRQHRDPTA